MRVLQWYVHVNFKYCSENFLTRYMLFNTHNLYVWKIKINSTLLKLPLQKYTISSSIWGVRINIIARKYLYANVGYCFLIRYQLCAWFGVRAAYYVGDPLISTSNPPVTHSSATKPRYWGFPRLNRSLNTFQDWSILDSTCLLTSSDHSPFIRSPVTK